MYTEDGQYANNIYENPFVEDTDKKESTEGESPELTGSDSVKIRSYRAAVVCLVLLCVLLLTAVIVLCVLFTQERQQLMSKTENLTKEREQLILKNTNLTNELEDELQICGGWAHYQSSFYNMSSEAKNWTEGRRYCRDRGADLIIINNREEHDFVKKRFSGNTFWMGLTDSDVEGSWKWVDGSTLNSSFSSWWPGEPGGKTTENCAVMVENDQRWSTLYGWFDVPCNYGYQWICEKRIS